MFATRTTLVAFKVKVIVTFLYSSNLRWFKTLILQFQSYELIIPLFIFNIICFVCFLTLCLFVFFLFFHARNIGS